VVDEVSLHVEGLDPSWYRLEPERLNLFPGASGTATLSLQLPEPAVAGRYPFRVLATLREAGGAPAGVDVSLDVPATGAIALILEPTRRIANREARYTARLSNPGNAVRTLRLDATDPESALEFGLTPADLMLAPGESASAEVRVRERAAPPAARPGRPQRPGRRAPPRRRRRRRSIASVSTWKAPDSRAICP
jgi:hypothetical protein